MDPLTNSASSMQSPEQGKTSYINYAVIFLFIILLLITGASLLYVNVYKPKPVRLDAIAPSFPPSPTGESSLENDVNSIENNLKNQDKNLGQ